MGVVKKSCGHAGACKHGVRPKKYPLPISSIKPRGSK